MNIKEINKEMKKRKCPKCNEYYTSLFDSNLNVCEVCLKKQLRLKKIGKNQTSLKINTINEKTSGNKYKRRYWGKQKNEM